MKEYVISILAVATIGSVVLILSPDGEGGGIKKHISFAVGLATILVVISPVTGAIESIRGLRFDGFSADVKENDEYESIFNEALEKTEISNLKSGVKTALRDKFGISESECSVEITLDSGKLSRIFIRLYGSAVWQNTREIESYLYNLLKCEIVTAIN